MEIHKWCVFSYLLKVKLIMHVSIILGDLVDFIIAVRSQSWTSILLYSMVCLLNLQIPKTVLYLIETGHQNLRLTNGRFPTLSSHFFANYMNFWHTCLTLLYHLLHKIFWGFSSPLTNLKYDIICRCFLTNPSYKNLVKTQRHENKKFSFRKYLAKLWDWAF